MKILVIGGSRFVGPLVINLLIKHKHDVTVFNRGNLQTKYPSTVKYVQGSRDKNFKLPEKFDAVIDTCAYNGKQTQKAVKELRFDYFLHFGTVASYQETKIFPITEEFETGIWPAFGDYNKGKVECEKVLAKSKIKYASIRPVYILGPKNYCDRENFIYSRINKGEPLIIPGDGKGLAQFVFADEVAKIMVELTEKQIIGSYNVCGNEYISLTGLVHEMGKIVGKKPVTKYNPRAIGANYKKEEFPFDNETMVISNEKIKNTLGFKFRPLVSGLRQDYKNYYQKVTRARPQ